MYAPEYILQWLNLQRLHAPKWLIRVWESIVLQDDDDAKQLWDWYAQTHPDESTAPLILIGVKQCLNFPDKPGDMSDSDRNEYFDRVRRHAQALIDLLEGTTFEDRGFRLASWTEDQFIDASNHAKRNIQETIELIPDEVNESRLVAYFVGKHRVELMPFDYPDSDLVGSLGRLIEWANQADYFGRPGQGSSAHLGHSGELRKVRYFEYEIHSYFKAFGRKEIPHRCIATLSNIVFQLPVEKLRSADVVKKTIARRNKI